MTDFKEKDTKILWSLVSEISSMMAKREVIPPSERGATFKETDEVMYDLFRNIVSEIDDRRE